jgi:hypothetical protein
MAKKGIRREYRKALSFTKDKWDLKNNQPKESSTSIGNVIEYVQLKMYQKSIVAIDLDDDDEVVTASKLEAASIKKKRIEVYNNKIDDEPQLKYILTQMHHQKYVHIQDTLNCQGVTI